MKKSSVLVFLTITSIMLTQTTTSQQNNVVLGYMHNKILQKNVPEFKNFCRQCRTIFKTKDSTHKKHLIIGIKKFGNDLIADLNQKLQKEPLTKAEKDSINKVIVLINSKLAKI